MSNPSTFAYKWYNFNCHEFIQIFGSSLPKYEMSKGNIKRENKMYSYKDQMAEMEMRKELESKKVQPIKNNQDRDSDNPLTLLASQLTKNQMEQVNIELEKERKIRNRMKEVMK